MRWGLVAGAVLMTTAVACLGTLRADPTAESMALVPAAELNLPSREGHRHWLLRGESGWCGAHELRYGGDPDDPGVATVRVTIFAGELQAQRAYSRLTPTYLYSLLRTRLTEIPRPVDYPEPLPGDAVRVLEYDVRLPVASAPDIVLYGQLTLVQAGRAVILVESIGVPPEQLVPAVREIVRAAHRLPPAAGC